MHQVGDSDDNCGHRLAVDRIRAAHPAQDFGRGDTVEHRERVGFGGRRQTKGHVLEHFDQHAAEAEGDDLAEARIGQRADDHLLAAGEHGLDDHAIDFGVRLIFLRAFYNSVICTLGLRRGILIPTTTPPASVLCRMSGDTTFITTGKPSSPAT